MNASIDGMDPSMDEINGSVIGLTNILVICGECYNLSSKYQRK